MAIASIVTASTSIGALPVVREWRPRWTKPFADASKDELIPSEERRSLRVWLIGLGILSLGALALQIARILKFPGSRISFVLLLVSWSLVLVTLAIARPRSSPVILLGIYISDIIAEAAVIHSSVEVSHLSAVFDRVAGLMIPLISIAIVLMMPLRPAPCIDGAVSTVGSAPKSTERSPEDRLRLWQFLTVSWTAPLLAIGKKRQLQKEDVWALGFEFHTLRYTRIFRKLRGSVMRRLLVANGVDCFVLVATAFISLFCGTALRSVTDFQLLMCRSRMYKSFVAPKAFARHGRSSSNPSEHDLCIPAVGITHYSSSDLHACALVR